MNRTVCKKSGKAIALMPGLLIIVVLLASFRGNLPSFSAEEENPFADTIKKDTAKYGVYKDLPLKPTRRISFNTNEGTWMSVDISPDGQTILFDLMGDIYTIPATGGNATVVTSGLAFDTHPRYSPDGKKI